MSGKLNDSLFNAMALLVGVPLVVGGGIYLLLFRTEHQVAGGVVFALLTLPAVIFVFVSLICLGAATKYKPLIDRESLLWSWLKFMGKGSAGILLLVAGSLIGGFLGAQFSSPNADFAGLLSFIIIAVSGWIFVVVAVWTVRAMIDVARVGSRRHELLEAWLKPKFERKSGQIAGVMTFGSEFTAVVLAGLTLEALVVFAFVTSTTAIAS